MSIWVADRAPGRGHAVRAARHGPRRHRSPFQARRAQRGHAGSERLTGAAPGSGSDRLGRWRLIGSSSDRAATPAVMADSAQWATVVFRWADDTRVDLLLCGQEPADLAVVEGLRGSSWRPGEAGGPCTSTRSPRSWRSCSSWLAYRGGGRAGRTRRTAPLPRGRSADLRSDPRKSRSRGAQTACDRLPGPACTPRMRGTRSPQWR